MHYKFCLHSQNDKVFPKLQYVWDISNWFLNIMKAEQSSNYMLNPIIGHGYDQNNRKFQMYILI